MKPKRVRSSAEKVKERAAVSEDSQPLSYRAVGMGRIEGQLLAWHDEVDAVDGRRLVDPYKEFPEFDLYNKAWRLKRLGRCPLCGKGVRAWRCIPEARCDVECTKCEFGFSVDDSALLIAKDVDDPIIEAVRLVLVGQEVLA